MVHDDSVAVACELSRYRPITFYRPLLGAPARARIQQNQLRRFDFFEIAVAPCLPGGIAGKDCLGYTRRTREFRGEFEVLFNHVRASSVNVLLLEPTRWTLSRHGETDNLPRPRPARNHR